MRPSTPAVALREETRPARRRVNPWRWLYVGLPVAAKAVGLVGLAAADCWAVWLLGDARFHGSTSAPVVVAITLLWVQAILVVPMGGILLARAVERAWRYIERRATEDERP